MLVPVKAWPNQNQEPGAQFRSAQKRMLGLVSTASKGVHQQKAISEEEPGLKARDFDMGCQPTGGVLTTKQMPNPMVIFLYNLFYS